MKKILAIGVFLSLSGCLNVHFIPYHKMHWTPSPMHFNHKCYEVVEYSGRWVIHQKYCGNHLIFSNRRLRKY